jgi:hypothetical protein
VNQEIRDSICSEFQAYHSQCPLNTGVRFQQRFQGGHAICFMANGPICSCCKHQGRIFRISSYQRACQDFPLSEAPWEETRAASLALLQWKAPRSSLVQSKNLPASPGLSTNSRRGNSSFGVASLISGLFLVSTKAFQNSCAILCVMVESLLSFVLSVNLTPF